LYTVPVSIEALADLFTPVRSADAVVIVRGGFWSLVKRGISGVCHSVGQQYLQSYLNEYSFRYNRRDSRNLISVAILAKVAELASLKPSAPVAENHSV
jgi:hypothetical protein